jgi:hypothetical protein
MDSSLSLGMTSPVMLNEAKHPQRTGFLATAQNDKEKARKIAPKVCVTRKVCGMTEKRCLA